MKTEAQLQSSFVQVWGRFCTSALCLVIASQHLAGAGLQHTSCTGDYASGPTSSIDTQVWLFSIPFKDCRSTLGLSHQVGLSLIGLLLALMPDNMVAARSADLAGFRYGDVLMLLHIPAWVCAGGLLIASALRVSPHARVRAIQSQ